MEKFKIDGVMGADIDVEIYDFAPVDDLSRVRVIASHEGSPDTVPIVIVLHPDEIKNLWKIVKDYYNLDEP